MYIVIAGAGLVGTGLAKMMRENHDVVVVEIDARRCADLYAELGVLTVNGSATDVGILHQAEIDRADVAVALMRDDADNLAFTLLAHQHKVPQRIVRMRDPRYREAYDLAGATYLVNVLDLYLRELFTAIERPQARRIAEIGNGEAELFAVRVPEGATAVGMKVQEIVARPRFPRSGVIAGILDAERGLTIPRGDDVISCGCEVLVVVHAEDVAAVVDCLTHEGKAK